VLDALDRVGVRYGVVTNKQARFSEPLIDNLRLRSRLCCLVSGDTARRAKPHADPLVLAAKLCGVATTQCVYIGDAHNDVIAARAANMPVAVATYGYIGVDEKPQSWNADALIAQPSDLHDWLQLPEAA
jgi:phosphoglycolate phosphatase-like HAD superfamily hydrolase